MKTAKQLTTKDLLVIFGVSHMTTHHWRNGSETKTPLPVVDTQGSRTVLFDAKKVKAWAKKNELAMLADPEVVAADGVAPVKPGPKPKMKAVTTKKPVRIYHAGCTI